MLSLQTFFKCHLSKTDIFRACVYS